MNSEKRFFLAIALSFLILVLYPIYLKWISPPGAKIAAKEQTSVASKTSEAVLKEPEIPREMAQALAKTHLFSGRHFDAEFSERGGAIVHLKLKKWDKAHSGDVVFIDKSSGNGAFLADLPNQGIDFTERAFALELLDVIGGQVRFSSEEAGKWKLTKTFHFDEDKPVIRLQVEIQNLSAENQSTGFKLQSALNVQSHKPTGSAQAQPSPPESFVALAGKLESVKLDKALKKPHIFEGSILWQALCENYFGIFVRPDSPASLSQVTARRNGSETLFWLLIFPPH